jgi:hypothetical protein
MDEELSKENEVRRSLKRYSIIKVLDRKYLILSLKKEEVVLLPLDNFLEEDVGDRLIPKISLRYESLIGYQDIDQTELLYLLNEKNSLIKKALHHLFYERK